MNRPETYYFDRPAVDSRSFRRNLYAGSFVLILLVFGIVGLSIYKSHQGYVARATAYLENMAEVLAKNVASEVGKIDLLLLAEADEVNRELKNGGVNGPLLNDLLVRHQNRVSHAEFGVVDKEGLIRFLSFRPVVQPYSVAERLYYRTPKTNPAAGWVVSGPAISKADGKRVLHFSRRITAPDGGFG